MMWQDWILISPTTTNISPNTEQHNAGPTMREELSISGNVGLILQPDKEPEMPFAQPFHQQSAQKLPSNQLRNREHGQHLKKPRTSTQPVPIDAKESQDLSQLRHQKARQCQQSQSASSNVHALGEF